MPAERWQQIVTIFDAACALAQESRTPYLTEACGGDEELRREVESLLANEDRAGAIAFLEPSAGRAVPEGTQIGPYRIVRQLGAGGMGEVYAALDTRLERTVALKFLPAVLATDPAALERFRREAKAASALSHSNICTVHDIGEYEQQPFLVMELLEGCTLSERMDGQPLPLPEVIAIARHVALALAAAHAKEIVHRDIKPGNIFLTSRGDVKVLDFGLAKLATNRWGAPPPEPQRTTPDRPPSSLTVPGSPVGTIAYMSPEQANGENVDTRTDLFSLGVVLFEMATGSLPFHGETTTELLQAIIAKPAPLPRSLNPRLPAELERIVLKALAKNRSERYGSAVAFHRDLVQLEAAVAAAPAQTRRRALAGIAGTVLLAGGGVAWSTRGIWMGKRIRMAVLPLAEPGGAPEHAYFADGLHQELITVLRRLYPDDLGVMSQQTAKRYSAAGKDATTAGREMNVDYVVHGSVRRNGDRVRIGLSLARVRDGAKLWTDTYDRPSHEAIGLQAEVAQSIAHAIGRRLRPARQVLTTVARPLNPEAHEAYLRKQFAKAIEHDPNYAPAHARLAIGRYMAAMFGFEAPAKAYPVVSQAAARAVQLDPTLADAQVALALSKLHTEWKWTEAEEGFQRALRLDPVNPFALHLYAHFLLWLNRGRQSAEECARAAEYDPFDPDLLACVAWHDIWAGNYADAVEDSRRALELDPKHAWALLVMGQAYEQQGRYQEAIAALERGPAWDMRTASIAHAFAKSGNRGAAESLLAKLLEIRSRRYVSPYDLAVASVGLGDVDAAFAWLDEAYREKAVFLVYINLDPRFKPLRREARYKSLLRNMGLAERG